MGLFQKFREGLQKSQARLVHDIQRIVSRSPRLEGTSIEELEAALIAADLGLATTDRIIAAVKRAYETQGGASSPKIRR
jgi:fused signal recognition particle receptor